MALLDMRGVEVSFPVKTGGARALKGVDLSLDRGERLGVVGESGAGKSMLAFAALNLIAEPGRITGGSVRFDGEALESAPEDRLRRIRGGRVAMIFQDPMATLNPVLTIERQMVETLRAHRAISHSKARAQALAALKSVGVPSAETRLRGYPHELSGGLRQRVVIAIALLTEPEIIIADEPTTALDVTIQAGVMRLLNDLSRERGLGLMIITHDLALVAETTDRLMVMYAGRVVEQGPTRALIERPKHPYTAGLIAALPEHAQRGEKLTAIPGAAPSLSNTPTGCAFHPRCARASARCAQEVPGLERASPDSVQWRAACFHPLQAGEQAGEQVNA